MKPRIWRCNGETEKLFNLTKLNVDVWLKIEFSLTEGAPQEMLEESNVSLSLNNEGRRMAQFHV